jgi:hypothetical protein
MVGEIGDRAVAVAFVAILVVSMTATPVMAGASHSSSPYETTTDRDAESNVLSSIFNPGNGNPPGNNGPPGHERGQDARNVAIPELNSSLESLYLARDRALGLAEEHNEQASEFEAIADSINATIDAYRGADRIDNRSAFGHTIEAQRRLADLDTTVDSSAVESVSEPLYDAINRSTRLNVRDGAHTVLQYETEFRNRGQRQRVESHLGNAVDAIQRAEERLRESPPRRGGGDSPSEPQQRAQAIGQLENAWKHAERTLDGVESNVDPTLGLSTGRALEHNGSIVVPVRATVTDVRPYEYDSATVTTDSTTRAPDTISLVSSGLAGSYASGTTLLYTDEQTQNLTVAVSATATHDTDRRVTETRTINLEDLGIVTETPAPDEFRSVSVSNSSSGVTATVNGTGLHEGAVEVHDETPETDSPYRAGPMVRIENRTSFAEATVQIPIEDDLNRQGNLSVYTWDPQGDGSWHAVETEIDRDLGVATAEVDHFSYFSVFWVESWNDTTSDTISLEDEYVEGNLTDRNVSTGDPLKADFVFVIDTSGSMSGDRIQFARLAAQRFVGALYAEERAGLVTFASYGSLRHGLTTNHTSLNASISSLGTGGSTNTGDGLQDGIGELSSNGWDNRSKEMLLLADGGTNRGPNPVSVAETAADNNITINTVGVGSGIDENELREIAGATGGDFYHVLSAEDLPETFERVAENRSISLTDSDDDGLPDAVEEMDLRMPTGGPGIVGEPLNLDPSAADTSGDGILDNETVDVTYRIVQQDNETKLHARITYARSHPARIDTTGNGLTDRAQPKGWEIQYTPDREHTVDLMEDLRDAEDLSDLGDTEEYFRTETVTANPLVEDTNGDGLTDLEERRLGTNPRDRDTTGDGITDRRAVEGDTDPTLYDIVPPEVNVLYTRWEKPEFSFDTHYDISFNAEDPAGLGTADVFLDGDKKGNPSLSGTFDTATSEFSSGVFDSVTDIYSGTAVTIQVSDLNSNSIETTAINRYDIFGQVANKLAEEGILGRDLIESLGMLSGFSTGAVETAEMFAAFMSDPVGYIAALQDVIGAVDNLDEVIRQLPASVADQQQQNNPHEEGTDEYEAYRTGWYKGYVGYMVLETAMPGGQVGRAAKSSNRLQRAVDTLDSAGRLSKAARYASRTADVSKAPVRYTGYQLSRGLSAAKGISQQTGRKLLDGASTVGQQVRWARHADEMDAQTLRIIADGGTNFRRDVYRAADSDAIDSYQQLQRGLGRIDDLDSPRAKTHARQLVDETGGDGVRLLADMDNDALEAFYRMEQKAGFSDSINFRQWRANVARGSTDLDPSWTNNYIKDVEKAASHVNIENADGLVRELSGNNANPSQVLGQAGEARSAMYYANTGYEVTVEPAAGDYDMATRLAGQTEYVEVKTRKGSLDDSNYWKSQIEAMNKKNKNADNVPKENAVLEVQTTADLPEIDAGVNHLQVWLDTKVNTNLGEVRIRSSNADTVTIPVEE